MNYRKYLQSDYWKERRFEFRKATKQRCWICGSKKDLQVHHKRYQRKWGKTILFREKNTDLRLLCDRCHGTIHQLKIEKIFASGLIRKNLWADLLVKKCRKVMDIRFFYDAIKDQQREAGYRNRRI